MIHGKHALRLALCASAAAAFLPPQAAAAQSAPSTPIVSAGDIVVTAQKKSENIQKVPAQVSVIGAANIEELHATNLADIGAYVPGLQINSGGTPGQTTVSLRGIAPIGPAATVASYIDESPVGSTSINAGSSSTGTSFSLDLLPYDVERIEVLQGPQGTLYGANSLGGLVKYVLKAPSLDRVHGDVGADLLGVRSAGKLGGGGHAVVSIPIITDKLAVLGSYSSESTPGYIDNGQTGQRNQNHLRQQSARAALLWQPESNLSVKLGFLWQKSAAANNAAVALNTATRKPIAGDLRNDNILPEPSTVSLHHYSVQLDYDFGFAKLISATSYSDTRSNLHQDATRENASLFGLAELEPGLSPFRQILDTKKFTQEVRLSSPSTGKLEWLIGAFYTHEKTRNDQLEEAQFSDGTPVPGFDPLFHADLPDTYREYAFFGDATYHFTPKLDLAGGVRYAKNKQDFPVTASGTLIELITGGDAAVFGSSSEGVVTYSVGPRYQITDTVLAYGRVSSGYQAGGPNIPFPGIPASVKSDRITNYEVGLKTQFWDKRALLNVALFRIDWRDIQILGFIPGLGFTYLDNGGKARSQGISVDASVKPAGGLTLSGNITYDDAKLTEDVPTLGGASGDRLPYTPTWSGSAQADYALALGGDVSAHLNAGLRVVGQRYSSVQSSADAYRLKRYAAADFGASLGVGNYTARLFVKNAFDKRAYDFYALQKDAGDGSTTQIEATPIQPRTIGVAVDARF